jgi:AcrR family transcriptional regulator
MASRLASIEETRSRITAAAFALHTEIGPSRTTIRGIAERAGVQRHTVYAHFPDLEALYAACTAHGIRATAMPDGEQWPGIFDPGERLRVGLTELYAWYRANERMLLNVLRDGGAEVVEAAHAAREPDAFDLRMGALRAALGAGWDHVDPASRPSFDAALTHALAFETWRSLATAGLDDGAAVELMVAFVRGLADGTLRPA